MSLSKEDVLRIVQAATPNEEANSERLNEQFKEQADASREEFERLVRALESHKSPQQKVLDLVVERRKRQDAKWGRVNNDWPIWNNILGEEFGEVCKAFLEGNRESWKQELIDVAAVAVAALEFLIEHESAEQKACDMLLKSPSK